MIVVVGTPRSGTTFVVNWIANNNPTHTLMQPDDLGELFQPYFYTTDNHEKETSDRISLLTDLSIFKLHTGVEMPPQVWKLIEDIPVIVVRRADILGQFISFGLGFHTNQWITYNASNSSDIEPFHYKQEWFDDLAQRLNELDNRLPTLNIAQTIWYEDIPYMKLNGSLPQKQSKGTNADKSNSILNLDEFLNWYDKFTKVRQPKGLRETGEIVI
jgi:hypothetical protein